MVILWVPSDKPQMGFGESSADVVDKEFWRPQRILQYVLTRRPFLLATPKLTYRVTGKHVYDIAWSPDGEFLIAGATDNTASIWKAGTGELPPTLAWMKADTQVNAYMRYGNINIMSRE